MGICCYLFAFDICTLTRVRSQWQEKGIVQILPEDNYGRPVLFWDRIRSVHSVLSIESCSRIHFYLLQTMLEERSDVVKNGFIRLKFLKVGQASLSISCLRTFTMTNFCFGSQGMCAHGEFRNVYRIHISTHMILLFRFYRIRFIRSL